MPKFVAYKVGADEAAHLRAVGYRVTSDEGEPVQLEGTDDFITRMQAWLTMNALLRELRYDPVRPLKNVELESLIHVTDDLVAKRKAPPGWATSQRIPRHAP